MGIECPGAGEGIIERMNAFYGILASPPGALNPLCGEAKPVSDQLPPVCMCTDAHAPCPSAIPREELEVEDTVQALPCGHVFHLPCLAPWLKEHNSCPTCR